MTPEAAPTRKEVFAGLATVRDEQFAELVALVLTLAAERCPEAIHKALSKVFDLGEASERMYLFDHQAKELWATLEATRDRLQEVNREFKDLENGARRLYRLEQENVRLLERVARLEERCGRMARFLNEKFRKVAPTVRKPT